MLLNHEPGDGVSTHLRPRRSVCSRAAALLLVCSTGLGGCAVTHVGEDGAINVYGLAFGEVRETTDGDTVVASALDIRSIGLGIYLLPTQNSVTLGYGRVSGVLLQDNVFVSLDNSETASGMATLRLEDLEAMDNNTKGTDL